MGGKLHLIEKLLLTSSSFLQYQLSNDTKHARLTIFLDGIKLDYVCQDLFISFIF